MSTVAARPQQTIDGQALAVLRQFRIVFNAVRTHFKQVEKLAGVGGAQVWALSLIGDQPGLRVTELARRMDIHQSTASNLVRSLVDGGYASASRGASDRRAVQLKLLPAGQALRRKLPQPFAGVLPAALDTLDAQTLARLEHDLQTLIAALPAKGRDARKPLADM